ncbi:MAG TPA: DNA gyrase subunit A [Tepidisphaeraceae bacterium]|nr:DNA gyrase subunit A [Tepidisphaeraceae bacterium]
MSEPSTGPIDRIEDLQIEQELQDSYLTYAMSTIMDRALPDVRDGLKPSQRRILVAMRDLNLGPRSKHLKCAKIAGNTSGDYHPHGEAIVYPTLVRLAQDWALRYPLVDGQGNFGSTDGDPPAAMRYTEARPSHVENELLADLEYDTVNYQPNYDERLMEPTVLPAKFPNLLVNGSTGIAVGMACNLLPHNLREICDAIVHVIDHPDCGLNELMERVPGPDFPTAGIICGRDGIIEGYRTGRGKICLRARLAVEEQKNGRSSIIVEEIPYGVIRKTIVESVAEAVKKDLMNDISAINDESGRQHKCRIVIDLKRDADPQLVINQLYEYTPCQVTVSMINIALVNRQPRTMGLKELIQHFIEHRKEVITRRTRFLLRKAQQRGHILEGLIFAVVDIDEVIKLIRSSATREEAIQKLRERGFRIPPGHPYALKIPQVLLDRTRDQDALLSQAQAENIGRLQLIQLVGLEIDKLVNEYREVAEEIEGYEAILRDQNLVLDIIREDIMEMREKYGDDRRTEITGAVSGFNMDALITQEDVVVTVSHNGYVKRLPVDTYRSQSRGGRGIKGTESREGDFVQHLFVANTHDYLLFFTNQGRVYERRVYDVPEGSRTSQGRSIANLLEFQKDEKIANVLAVKDFGKDEHFLMFATRNGVVKKTALSAYANIRTNGIIAIGLEDSDTLIGVEITSGNDEILLGTKQGMAIRFKETDVRAMGRPAGGVKGIELGETVAPEDKSPGADQVVDMLVIPHDPTRGTDGGSKVCMVLTGCENGFGKRTPVDEYRLQRRGGSGVINIKTTDRNGDVVGMKAVCDDDDVMLITQKGILMRTRVAEIRETGRNAQGVKLIRVDEGDRLVAMAKVDAEEVKVGGAAATTDDGSPPADGPTDGQAPADGDATDGTPPPAPEASGDGDGQAT